MAHWLITARNGDDDGILLSGAGNAHSGKFDIPLCPYNLNDPDELKIEYAISSSAVAPRRSPFFVPLHILHPESCHRHFSKFIRVTYTLDDMQELSVVFLLKNLIEGRNIQPMMYNTKLREREYFLRRNMSFFSEIRNENVLCVSWNELIRGSIDTLATRLSSFTEIPSSQFDINSIAIWRSITLGSIDNFLSNK